MIATCWFSKAGRGIFDQIVAVAHTMVLWSNESGFTRVCFLQCRGVLSAHPEDAREKWCHVCGRAVDRDGNAADNIASVWPHFLAHGSRPVHLRRCLV